MFRGSSTAPDEGVLELLADRFDSAALGLSSWDEALAGLAEVCGARSGQLIGIGGQSTVPFNHVTEVPAEGLVEFVVTNGGDPRVNRRVAAGVRARELAVVAENDFATPHELAADPYYAGFFEKWDIPFICQTNLLRRDDLLIGLAVLRTRRQGHIEAAERAVFEALAPRVRSAVLTRRAIDAEGAKLLVGAMEALSKPVFVFDALSRVMAMSASAEALVSTGSHLRMRQRRLAAAQEADTRRLHHAVAAASGVWLKALERRHTTLAIAGPDGADPLLVELAPFPQQDGPGLGFGARCMAVVRIPRESIDKAITLAREVYGLTQAEAEVAVALARGEALGEVAVGRGVSSSTVRNQLKALFLKVGVRRQAELVKKLERFLG